MSQYYDQTSESIYDGVLTIFGRAATQDLNMPSRSKLNVDAQAHIHMKTELFVSDAAADEVLVGRMMKKRRMNDVFVDPDFFPGMRHRLNDRAHAFRRVTKRGWSDRFLKQCHMQFVRARFSPSQLIRHSKAIKAVFNRFRSARRFVRGALVRHSLKKPTWMNAAMHRFDSDAKPMSRCILYFQPMVQTMNQVANGRAGQRQGKLALQWQLSVTTEHCLQSAQMADAADEALQMVRLTEPEEFDESCLRAQIDNYLDRLRALYFDERCWDYGYTCAMVRHLTQDCCLKLPTHTFKYLGRQGGVHDWEDIKHRCLRRMQMYVMQVEGIVKAEFPEFQVTQSFSIFNLDDLLEKSPHELKEDGSASIMLDIARLTQFFAPHASDLKQDYFQILPMAMRKRRLGMPLKLAWATALREAQSLSKAARSPLALIHVLVRWACWSGSSGGVERLFALSRHSISAWRQSMTNSNTEDELMVLGAASRDYADIAKLAQLVWSEHFGDARLAYTQHRARKRAAIDQDNEKVCRYSEAGASGVCGKCSGTPACACRSGHLATRAALA